MAPATAALMQGQIYQGGIVYLTELVFVAELQRG